MSNPAFRTVNPATGEQAEEYPFTTDAEIDAALKASHEAFAEWGSRPIEERAAIVQRVADLFAEKAGELASVATGEMGKPIGEMREEAEFCSEIFGYYASHGPTQLGDQVLSEDESSVSMIQRRPVGALLGIMPWNYPYYQVARFVAPNLVTGNTILLKHAEICPGSALAIQAIMEEAGVPAGVYQNIFATYDQVSTIIASPIVQGVSLTGSERAGSSIAAQAGQHLKKAVLELGGSDPYVVLSSKDVRAQAREALEIRLENTGQACNSNKRMIVMDDIFDEFVDELVKQVDELQAGDPAEGAESTYGPMSSETAAQNIVAQIEEAVSSGATLHTGGTRQDRPGFYVAPAVITGVTPASRAYREELFGPAAVVYRVSSDEEALQLANDTVYGLGAAVYATEQGRAETFAEKLEAGMVGANAQAPETADMPFGGVKRSGYGRELGPLGIDEFVNKRLMHVAKNG
ncbi:MAG TPA: NAD-dependent succinate-semialdehyde dehydrogenase [Candidatus Nesterenkonia stercoripullorum]|uniref:NAD-dependent succinate-semialdehyde dehydrogenase n=1 Tax=Candidatus Nesterenkonia stercoripullorum TaxID=2838701 RepID=A0A9D1UTA7_9MICC|nr:NAD-dependent succinate-semialdehyde dehydrogenase [Candidatus Nesterenkonia stercoripullorum]